jgi:hypothetical protein
MMLRWSGCCSAGEIILRISFSTSGFDPGADMPCIEWGRVSWIGPDSSRNCRVAGNSCLTLLPT